MKDIFKKMKGFIEDDKKVLKSLIGILILVNVVYLPSFFMGDIKIFDIVVLTICDIFYPLDIILVLKNIKMKTGIAVAESIGESAQKLYLCGFSLDKYIVTDAFIRLGGWLNNGHCWVTAALGMFLLRHNDTAKLCKGICQRHNRNGGGSSIHYWVEFDAENRHYVLDLCWIGGFCDRKTYYKDLKPDVKWTCTYDEFWSIQASNRLYESMHGQKTSYVFDLLVGLYWNDNYNKGFADGIADFRVRDCTGWRYMIPVPNDDELKICWALTLRDFVKNPKRKQPKARSQRIARWAWHYLERNRAKNSSPPTETPA